MEELHTTFKVAGATLVGAWPTDGYEYSDSKVCIALPLVLAAACWVCCDCI